MISRLLRFVAAAALLALPVAAEAAGSSAEIPLHVRPGHSGFANLVTVSVGGGPAGNVLFDTGSTGLRILASAIGPNVRLTNIPSHYSYTSGNVLDGVVGYAKVSFPGANPAVETPKEIAIQVVQRLHCAKEHPHCPGWKNGQVGVMGTAYTGVTVFNPLAQLGAPLSNGFIVATDDLARPGLKPHVTVGLTKANSAGFAFAPFASDNGGQQPAGLKAWNTKSVHTCFTVDNSPQGCYVTVFDTGAGVGSFQLPDRAPHGMVRVGSTVTTEVAQAGMKLSVKAGKSVWTNRYQYEPPHGGVLGFNSGAMAFRHMEIAYDAEGGRIGFRNP